MSQFASYPSLKDRSVFVSGGGSGIGASIVEHFAGQGAKVAFADIDDAASTALTHKLGGRAIANRFTANATCATSGRTSRF